MNLKKFITSQISHNSPIILNNSESYINIKNHSISSHNFSDIYNKLPQKENIKINNQSTISVIRKRILNSKTKKNSSSIIHLNKLKKKDKTKSKIEVHKKIKNQNKKKNSKSRKSFNEYQFNYIKKLFNIDKTLPDNKINNELPHNPIMKFNSFKNFHRPSTITEIKENNNTISLKGKTKNDKNNNYKFSKIKNKNNKIKLLKVNHKKQFQICNLKGNTVEMDKLFYKKNDLFSSTTYNIYNVNTPIYNLISIPSVYHNNNNKNSLSPRFNDLSNLSTDKNFYKKPITLNCFIDSDLENEKSQLLSNNLNLTEKDMNKKLRIKNCSFSTINCRNEKFIQTYNNQHNDKDNCFKSLNGLKTTKNSYKDINIIKKINNDKKNINIKNKVKSIGLKKYLTYFQGKNDKIKHNKQQSISILGKINNQSFKDSIVIPKINKRIMKINSCTLAGYVAPGIQKINQDNFFIKKDFLNEPEQFFIGICDGHGIQGHLISEYVSNNLANFLNDINDESIKKAYLQIHDKLQHEKNKIDSSLSGTTCTSIIISQNKVICANVGDSRAILARYENGIYNSISLSRDHKPTETDEMKRILLEGGRIKQFYDPKIKEYIGPERIWLKNSEIPGLAMSRSIGDTIAHNVGVISEPEIKKINFTGTEKFIVIASDGIWEYIDSDECINIIKDYYENNMDAVGGLNALVKEAFKRWKIEDENIDDITAIVLFFE